MRRCPLCGDSAGSGALQAEFLHLAPQRGAVATQGGRSGRNLPFVAVESLQDALPLPGGRWQPGARRRRLSRLSSQREGQTIRGDDLARGASSRMFPGQL